VVNFIALRLLLLPLHLLHALITHRQLSHVFDQVISGIYGLGSNVTFYLLLGAQYLYPSLLDDVMLQGLYILDTTKALYNEISAQKPKVHIWSEVRDYLKRAWQRLRITLAIIVLLQVPVVSTFVIPAFTFYITQKTLGYPIAGAIAVLSLEPHMAVITREFLEVFQDTRILARELCEPYFYRRGWKPKVKREFMRGNGWMVTGFAVVWVLPVRLLPVIGVVLYILAQFAVGSVLLQSTTPGTASKADAKKD